jgi:hypothetical protein
MLGVQCRMNLPVVVGSPMATTAPSQHFYIPVASALPAPCCTQRLCISNRLFPRMQNIYSRHASCFFSRCLSLLRANEAAPRPGILARWALSIPRNEGQLTPAPVRASVCEGMLEKIAALGAVADVMAGAKRIRRAHASNFAVNGCSLLFRRAAALYEISLAQSADFYSTLVLSSKPDFAHSTRHSVTSRNALKSFCCSKNAQATRHLNATLPNCGFCLIFQHSSQSFEPDPQVKAP